MSFKTLAKSSRTSITKSRRTSMSVTAALSLTAALLLSGCGSFSFSDESKEQGKTAICAAGGGLVSQIRTGGATTKFIAGIVKDNSTGDIQKIAESISNGSGDEEAASKLADYVDGLCN